MCDTHEWQVANAVRGTQHMRLGKLSDLHTVILGGGGIKGLAYIGIHIGMMDNDVNVVDHAAEFIGCSIGAFTAMLLAMRVPVADMLAAVQSMRGLQLNPLALLTDGGLNNMKKIRDTIITLLTKHTGDAAINLADFAAHTTKRLVTVVTDVVTETILYLTPETHPTMPVVDAVLDSMRIPMLFPSHDLNDGTTVLYDGGIIQGFPVPAASNPKTTLAFRFDAFKDEDTTKHHFAATNLMTKIANAFTMTAAVASDVAYSPHYARMEPCTARINIPFLSWMDMNVKQKDLDAAVAVGHAIGRCVAAKFMDAQLSPTVAPCVTHYRRTAHVSLAHLAPTMDTTHSHINIKLAAADLVDKPCVTLMSVAITTGVAATACCRHACADKLGLLVVAPLAVPFERRGDHHLKLMRTVLHRGERITLTLLWDASATVLCRAAYKALGVTFDWCCDVTSLDEVV